MAGAHLPRESSLSAELKTLFVGHSQGICSERHRTFKDMFPTGKSCIMHKGMSTQAHFLASGRAKDGSAFNDCTISWAESLSSESL